MEPHFPIGKWPQKPESLSTALLPTTMSKVYQETPSPYSPNMKLPLTRPLTSPVEQTRRAQIFSMPKLAAVEGQRQYRCNTPNAPPSRVERSIDMDPSRTLDPVFASSPQSPSGTCSSPNKPRVVVSEKYSWNPDQWFRVVVAIITTESREPRAHQKLKMVTKAAVRLHSKGDLQRAIELYLLALSSETNDQVKFRLRINLACAYEAAENLSASIEEFRLALELNPNDPYAIYKLGSVLTSVGEFEEARMRFESILDEYSQAADGLQTLDNAVETHRQEEEATRAAIAAAKTRRSPSKVLSPRIHLTTLREPIAPLTPVAQSPTPRRKINAAAKQESPALRAKQSPPKPETTTVATLTDTHLASPNLLGLLVRRCREARINILEVLQQRLGDAGEPRFPALWRFINAYTEQHQVEAQHLVSGEVGRVKRSIDDLIRNDLANISSHNVSGWMRSGSERAAVEVHRNSPLSATFELNSYDGEAAAGDTTGKQSGLGSGTDGTRSAPDLHANGEDLFTPRTRARKDRAREEWLLTAEKARVLARRQQRSMKSLRDIAARAKAHIISRRNAVAFLLVVAQNAQEEVKTRKLRCVLAKQEEIEEAHTNHHDEAARLTESTELVPGSNDTRDGVHLNTVKGLSEETFMPLFDLL
ncbi:Tetratricopeptide repeat [Phytophthora cactorum]|nr:Tetratricopeptide repeat [Phytophthora cactorum]